MSSSSDFDWKKKPHVLHSIIFHIPLRKKIARILERSNLVDNIVTRGAKIVPFARAHLFFRVLKSLCDREYVWEHGNMTENFSDECALRES